MAKKVLIIEARFYDEIADNLANAAIKTLEDAGVAYERISVPGAFEIPGVVAFDINGKQAFDGYIALGCVIRGETSHYDYVCGGCTDGLVKLAVEKSAAIGFGVLTTENKEQANVRASGDKNWGVKAAKACLTQMELKDKLS
jgi:6,7-dimethyl-8-ribityllumazine synthase